MSASLRRPGLFFTGTDTGVGKTVVMATVARCLRAGGRRVGVCKPVATGASRQDGRWLSEDTIQLARAAEIENELERVTPWVFAEPLAPAVAAARAGVSLAISELVSAVDWWTTRADVVLVEGVGGMLCPLTLRETVADLAARLGFPMVIVARTTLGTLNHTLLTLEVASRRGLRVAGVVLNEVEPPGGGGAEQTNPAELQRRIDVPVLAIVRHRHKLAEARLEELDGIDWWHLSGGASA